MNKTIIITFSEIALKGNNKGYFYNYINSSILSRARNNDLDVKYIQIGSRVFWYFEKWDQNKENILLNIIENIIGIAWISIGYFFYKYEEKKYFEAIDKILSLRKPKTYRISGKDLTKINFNSSMDMIKHYASYIDKNHKLKVNLENYDINLEMKIENKNFNFISFRLKKGLEGLPPGSMGEGLVLLSGGIDSPVSSFMMQSRGMNNYFVSFLTPSTSSEKTLEKIKELAKLLNKFNLKSTKLFFINIKPLQRYIREYAFENYRTILLRRAFIRVSYEIAKKYNLNAFIGGDSLGQVSSQTLESQYVIQQASKLLYFKPLIGMNKNQIIEIAKKIGTYDISIKPGLDTCSNFAPKNPITRPILEKTLNQEKQMIRYDQIIQEILEENIEEIDL